MSVSSGSPALLSDIVKSLHRRHNFREISTWERPSTGNGVYRLTAKTPDNHVQVINEIDIYVDKGGNTIEIHHGRSIYQGLTLETFNSVVERLCSYNFAPFDNGRVCDIALIARGARNNNVVVEKRRDSSGPFSSFPFFKGIKYGDFNKALHKLLLLDNGSIKEFEKSSREGPTVIVIIKTDEDLMHVILTLSASFHNLTPKEWDIHNISDIRAGGPTNHFSATGFEILKDLYGEMWPVQSATEPGAKQSGSPFAAYHNLWMPGAHNLAAHDPVAQQGTDETMVVLLCGRGYRKQIFMENAIHEGLPCYKLPFFGNTTCNEIVSRLEACASHGLVDFQHTNHYKVVHLEINERSGKTKYAILINPINDQIANSVKEFIQHDTKGLTFGYQILHEMYTLAREGRENLSITAAGIILKCINIDGNLK
jgi:hypothetical protein